MNQAELVALSRSGDSVLMLGEPGSGKRTMAESLHLASGRTGRYVRVICRELAGDVPAHACFGTSDGGGRAGYLERAVGGTLFFEEIAEMPEWDQRLLLRVLEAGAGDVRLLASTSRPPAQIVLSGAFDADLFRRLSGHVVVVPPLRERGRGEFVRLALEFGEWDAAALEAAAFHDWPGNLRELREFCARVGGRIREEDVVERLRVPADPQERLWRMLRQCRGRIAEVGRRLGTSPATIYRRMTRLGIPRGAGRTA